MVAFSAYGAAQALAVASTGTAIASLSGAAATNATLAFFGGGSLAAGGLGMAGGTVVLGGLVAGPALLVMGFVAGHAAKKELEKARTNKAEAQQVAANWIPHHTNVTRSVEEPVFFITCWRDWMPASCHSCIEWRIFFLWKVTTTASTPWSPNG